MHTPGVVIGTTSDPYTSETLIDNPRIVKGARVGPVWTEPTAWLVCFDGAVHGRRVDPIPERDLLGRSEWARAAEEE